MAVRITTPASKRTRRKRGAVSLSGGDVPIVTPTSDPGVQIPPPVDIAGDTFKALGETFDEFADVGEKIIKRKAAVDIADRSNKFNEDVVEELRNITAEQDLSDDVVADSFSDFMEARKQKLLNEHTQVGTPESLARLKVRLGDIQSKMAMEAGAISAVVGRQKVDQILDTDLSSLITSVQRDPANLDDALSRWKARIDDLAGAIPEDEEAILRQHGPNVLASIAIQRAAGAGDIEGAEKMLRSATRVGLLDADTTAALSTGLTDARLSRNEALFNIAQAEVALGRDLTQDEILRAFDLAPGSPLVQLNLPSQPEPGTRFGTDPDTGEQIVIPIPGSKAARETAKAEREAEEREAAEAAEQRTTDIDTALFARDFDAVIKVVEDTSDLGRAFLSRLPLTEETAAKNILQTIKDRFTLDNLLEIKKQGGTLGALNETEFRALGSRFGALDFDMPKEQLLPILSDARDIIAAESIGDIGRIKEVIKDIISRPPEGELLRPKPSQKSIDFLKANPDRAAEFDNRYGDGEAAKFLEKTETKPKKPKKPRSRPKR